MSYNFGDLLIELKQKGISFSFENGKLIYNGPEINLTPEIIQKMKDNKTCLIRHFWSLKDSNLMPISPGGSKIPFTLVHGDRANYFVGEYLDKDQPFYGFFHLGSDGKKITFKTVEEFSTYYISQLKVIVPNGPFLLGGFSFGGIVAYDMAIKLQQQGYEVPLLILVDCSNPLVKKTSYYSKKICPNIKKWVSLFFYHNLRRRFKRLICNIAILINKPTPEKYRNFYIIDKYCHISVNYKPTKFNGRILLFKATKNRSQHKYLGWDQLCDGVDLVMLEGTHLSIIDSEKSQDIFKKRVKQELENINDKYSGQN